MEIQRYARLCNNLIGTESGKIRHLSHFFGARVTNGSLTTLSDLLMRACTLV